MRDISNNLIAAFLDGIATPEQSMLVINAAKRDSQLRAFLELSRLIDEDIADNEIEELPLSAMAASGEDSNRCVVMCELDILAAHGIFRTVEEWERQARNQGWMKDGGVALYNIGRMLEQECFSLSRTFDNTIESAAKALDSGFDVIAVVDGKELTRNIQALDQEHLKNELCSQDPNHAVVVKNIDLDAGLVSIYDPAKKPTECSYPIGLFMEAWRDSSFYMITVCSRDLRAYEPHPIDLSDVKLSADLEELCEVIAENVHEVWAQGRKQLGWKYGPERNDKLKQTPNLVPYSDLTEEEKSFDRETAMNSIKLLRKLGYRILKD
ncbi:MAG: hypothetical protein LIP03_04135 [Bacteroidales bacterium]|nr:hypothetical protein [Bacteroidales bacterium]